jgi:hypothetical protein
MVESLSSGPGVAVRRLVEFRAVRAVVLVLALGVGGVAGAPTMALPPRTGLSISGGPDDADGDNPGGGGGGGGGPREPKPPKSGPGRREVVLDRKTRELVGSH